MIKDDPKKQTRRAKLKELQPSTEFLFGGQVKGVCQDMKDSMELNPLAWGGTGSGGKKSYRAGHHSGGGRGGSFSRHIKPRMPEDSSRGGRGRGKAEAVVTG